LVADREFVVVGDREFVEIQGPSLRGFEAQFFWNFTERGKRNQEEFQSPVFFPFVEVFWCGIYREFACFCSNSLSLSLSLFGKIFLKLGICESGFCFGNCEGN
jgi:hypothetical protein